MKIALLIYAAIVYQGAFEYKTGAPDSLFPMQIAVHDYSSPVVMLNPALLPFADGFIAGSSAGRPYTNEQLTTAGSAIQYGSGGDFGMQFSWDSFGADFYRENTFSLSAGYSIFPFLNAGVSGSIHWLKIDTGEINQDEQIPEGGYGILFAPLPWINAAFYQTGIAALAGKQNSEIIYPERSAGVLLKPGKGFSLAWNITETAALYANTFSAVINPAPFFSVKGGYCRENSSFSAAMGILAKDSMGILAKDFYISYGLKFHPYLGYTHSVGITYTPGSRMESLYYGKPLFGPVRKKININTASFDEIKLIDGLSLISAERIILFREKIGPITEKGLMQIGLTGDEIKNLEKNVYGLERTSRSKEGGEKYTSKKKK
ncbi:MAG: hypothetical protein CVV49_10735 [Spirochaetae bacterium HGW-Spirochaetae-5]|nr:MAG: hypothetical protein CVV49_10735 [Spirochaetae bacterium HGW-Spirochaetae-5]